MKKTFFILGLGLACVAGITSCSKGSGSSTPSSNAPSVSAPSDADGALVAVKVITTQTVAGYTIPIEIGTAAAWFGISTSFKDAGNVTIDGHAMSNSNNSYIFSPSQTTPTGLTFNNTVAWNVTGNSGNGITAFSYNDVSSFPAIDDISATGSIPSNVPFTLSATSGVSGDSVIFVVSGSRGHVSYIGGPNVGYHTFTAAEMATVGASANNTGLLQIAPYRLNHQVINGKNYYFIKEACVSKFITIN